MPEIDPNIDPATGKPRVIPPVADSSAARIAELESQLATMGGELQLSSTAFERLAPYEDVIKDLLEDPDYWQASLKAKAALRASQTPTVPPEFKPFEEKLNKLTEFVEGITKQQKNVETAKQQQAKTEAEAWAKSAGDFVSSLNGKTPGYLTGNLLANGEAELTDEGLEMVHGVSAIAKKHNLSFEDAFKRVGARYAVKPGSKAPPASLSADEGDPGIPGRGKQAEGEPVDFMAEFERRIAAGESK